MPSNRTGHRPQWGQQTLRGILLLVLLWYIAFALIRTAIIPPPHRVFAAALLRLREPATLGHFSSSLVRILGGISAALLCGIPVGIAAGRSRLLDGFVAPLLYLLYPIPKIALLPIFMVLLGIGDAAKISLIAVIIFFPITVAIRDAVHQLSERYLELARILNLSHRQVLRRIILPGILPSVFSAMRISLGIALSVLFISENIAAGSGLGFSIMNSWIMADYTGMYVGIVYLSLLGLVLYRILDLLETRYTPWLSH